MWQADSRFHLRSKPTAVTTCQSQLLVLLTCVVLTMFQKINHHTNVMFVHRRRKKNGGVCVSEESVFSWELTLEVGSWPQVLFVLLFQLNVRGYPFPIKICADFHVYEAVLTWIAENDLRKVVRKPVPVQWCDFALDSEKSPLSWRCYIDTFFLSGGIV